MRTLLAGGRADRVGAWIESFEDSSADDGQIHGFRGAVAERDGDATPAEWSRLFPGPPLPEELLLGLRTVEQDLAEPPEQTMIGTLIEMRRALWVPLVTRGHLRGVLFAGQRRRQSSLPRMLFESVAVELALALDLEDERRLGRDRHNDLQCVRSVLAAQANAESMGDILSAVVQDCTRKAAGESDAAAIFAAIGRPLDSCGKDSLQPTRSMCFAWVSGDPAWARALENEPLNALWRRALESNRIAGIQPQGARKYDEVARVVAFPLHAAGETFGVMVAGLRQGYASLEAVQRLELRAMLATSTLLRQKRKEEATEQQRRQQVLLAAVGAAAIVVRPDGIMSPLNKRSACLVGRK
jgi:GAF domain-containing protein